MAFAIEAPTKWECVRRGWRSSARVRARRSGENRPGQQPDVSIRRGSLHCGVARRTIGGTDNRYPAEVRVMDVLIVLVTVVVLTAAVLAVARQH